MNPGRLLGRIKRASQARGGRAIQWGRRLRPRRFRAYCVGTAKSGTHSLADLFALRYRSAHEPESDLLIQTVLSWKGKQADRRCKAQFVRTLDRRLRLEMNSSQLNLFFLETLAKEFPAAKFILTIRNPYAFADSFINHQLNDPRPDNPWRDFRLGRGRLRHVRQERLLENLGLYTLDGYFSYWAQHNRQVLEAVPPQRLLVVRTDQISRRLADIADFVGVDPASLDSSRSHSFRTKRKHGVLARLAPEFVEEKAQMHCGRLMREYFPEIRSLRDAL